MKTRFFRYSGAKFPYTEKINQFVQLFKNDIYIEPFVGSGALLFNLPKKFNKYIINDIDRNIIRIYRTFKEIDYSFYLNELEFIQKEFGDIKNKKEAYYNFRNWFNENYWNKDSIKEGVYLHILANSCINSMLRFGPNGMNQSYGNRLFLLDERSFNKIKGILSRTEIYNKDYNFLLEKYPDALFFLDPPYFTQGSSYTDFSKEQLLQFLENIKNLDFIYSDIKNEFNSNLFYEYTLREMRSTAPHSKKQKNGNIETIFCSKRLQLKSLF